jgi:hypothetical protein
VRGIARIPVWRNVGTAEAPRLAAPRNEPYYAAIHQRQVSRVVEVGSNDAPRAVNLGVWED